MGNEKIFPFMWNPKSQFERRDFWNPTEWSESPREAWPPQKDSLKQFKEIQKRKKLPRHYDTTLFLAASTPDQLQT